MSKRIKLSAYSVAQLLVLNAKHYGDEKGRETSRYRYTKQSLRSLSGWKRLSEPFIRDISDEMFGLGWTVIDLSDTEFAAIETRKISVWPKLGMRRVTHLARADDPEDAIDDAYHDMFEDDTQADVDDD
ncbi:MAG TPA: hypothetical protein VNS29_04185 [Burkholderiaceae bacterium]|nr:hypothetical protein [Burkholderiaceae bacterium]